MSQLTTGNSIKANITCNIHDTFTLNIDTVIASGKTTAIFGPSGSGKTTFLRCLAGLAPCDGEIKVASTHWQSGTLRLPPHKRPVGFVFQEASLFEHLNVEQNLRYAQKRAQKREIVASWDDVVDLFELAPLLGQPSTSLSGGERQRVAIARALLSQPDILFMDEPLASLDNERKTEALKYLQQLQQKYAFTLVYVTHSLDEIAQLADDLLVIESGKVLIHDTIDKVFSHVNFANKDYNQASSVISGAVTELDPQYRLACINTACGDFWIADNNYRIGDNKRLRLLASDISIAPERPSKSSILNCVEAMITEMDTDHIKPLALICLASEGQPLLAQITRKSLDALKLHQGQKVWAQIKSVAIAR